MGHQTKNTGGEYTRELPPAGNQLAICYGFVDLGTKLDNFDNMSHKVKLTWELCNEFRTNKEGEKIPFSISKEYTDSLNEKATLRQHLESWRGKGFTDKELDGFEMKNLIGIPCLLNIIHKESKVGNEYAVVTSIAPIMKGLEIPEMFHNSMFLSFQERPYNMEIYKKLPEYLRDLIAKSEEWKSINGNNKTETPIPENDENTENEFNPEPETENPVSSKTEITEEEELIEPKEGSPVEYSIEELQSTIKRLVGVKYDQEHQSIAVKQWLESMSVQGCKDRDKLEKFFDHLSKMKDMKQEEDIPFL